MARRARTQTQSPAEPSQETPLWQLLQQAQQQSQQEQSQGHHEPPVYNGDDRQSNTVSIHISVDEKDGRSLAFFLCRMHAYEELINKSMNNNMHISGELAAHLLEIVKENEEEKNGFTVKDCRTAVSEWIKGEADGVCGIEIDKDSVAFTGFDACEEESNMAAFRSFLTALKDYSAAAGEPALKITRTESERFDIYQLFQKMGLKGSEYKELRTKMMERLQGYSAFPDEESRMRWMAKHRVTKKGGKGRRA